MADTTARTATRWAMIAKLAAVAALALAYYATRAAVDLRRERDEWQVMAERLQDMQ
jgi:hypothetical protein